MTLDPKRPDFSADAGGVLVAIAGAVRIIQLRATAHRRRLQDTQAR